MAYKLCESEADIERNTLLLQKEKIIEKLYRNAYTYDIGMSVSILLLVIINTVYVVLYLFDVLNQIQRNTLFSAASGVIAVFALFVKVKFDLRNKKCNKALKDIIIKLERDETT